MLTQRAPKFSRLAVRLTLALACALLLFPAAAMAQRGRSRAAKDDSVPSGLVVVIENKPQQDRALDLKALDNPFISGVALQIRRRDIEPVEGKPDWSKLDQLFAAAESSKKWVQLLIFPGFFCSAMGPGRNENRTVRDSIWAWQRHRARPSDAMG